MSSRRDFLKKACISGACLCGFSSILESKTLSKLEDIANPEETMHLRWIKNARDKRLPALCYCSEGFAERMFSIVQGSPVQAIVASSVQRGDPTCVYRIEL